MAAFLNKLVTFGRALAGARHLSGAEGRAPLDFPFSDSDVARLHRIAGADDDARMTIDEPTWQGMLVPAWFARLTDGASIFGKQKIHRDLRAGQSDAQRAAQVARLAALEQRTDSDVLDGVLRPLRDADTEIASLLYEQVLPSLPRWAGKCWLLMLGLLLSVAAVMWSPLAWISVLFFAFQMLAVQARYHAEIETWDRARASVQLMLRSCTLAGKAASEHPALAEFAAVSRQAGRINRALQRKPMLQALPMLAAYFDWFLQANVEHYFKSVRLVGTERVFLRLCYELCAQLDADVALARHRAAVPTCWARGADHVRFDAAVHPLLDAPAPLSLTLPGGAFVSGQNGVGKSTLLRTVGLNLLAARSFGFCYAAAAACPMLPVVASMQSEDSLSGGASLYVAELTRARELLDMVAGGARAVFIIDEIFRGTNHLESVSAAAAVLDELAASNLVLVSSHNLVLASLLEHRLDPVCVTRDAAGRLHLAAGVLATTNGISLLAQHGFSERIDANARRVFAWLDGYMAAPGSGAAVLAPSLPDVRAA